MISFDRSAGRRHWPTGNVGPVGNIEDPKHAAKKMSSSLLTQDVLLFAFVVSIFGKLKPSVVFLSTMNNQFLTVLESLTEHTSICIHSNIT